MSDGLTRLQANSSIFFLKSPITIDHYNTAKEGNDDCRYADYKVTQLVNLKVAPFDLGHFFFETEFENHSTAQGTIM